MSFSELGLSNELLKAVADAGYHTPTPIQEKAIPYILMGRDVLGCAQTGTGKTASFTLPMIEILANGRARARMPRSLIIEPTRELAAQVAENFEKYGRHNKLSMALLIGGESFADQEKKLDRGVDVLIATPGRLIDLFERGKILLADTKLLVIDEADRMLDMGFMPDVERIVSLLPKIRQTLFFSATMAPEIRRLADKFLLNPKEISVSPPASPATTVAQRLVRSGHEAPEKRALLRSLLRREDIKSALIFCNRKRDVVVLERSLKQHGFDVGALHGDMAQPARVAMLDRFKRSEVQLLVCSDVAARGLDIPAVSHVVNFDVPTHAEDYIHRIGRTGRAGRSGKAFTIATPEDAKLLNAIRDLIGRGIEEDKVDVETTVPQTSEKPSKADDSESGKKTRTHRRSRKTAGQNERPTRSRKNASKPAEIESEAQVSAAAEPANDPEISNGDEGGGDNGGRVTGSGKNGLREWRDDGATPFGDATPAFLLRPIPQSARA